MKRTCLVYVLTFSLALNTAAAATLVFSWWKGPARAGEVSFGQKSLQRFLREDLNLMNEQSDRLLQHIDRRKSEVTKLSSRMDSNRSEMMALMGTSPINPTHVEAKVKEINHIQGQIRLSAVETVMSIAESLPPDARKKFGAYLRERGRICDGCCPGTGKGPFGDR